MDARTHKEGVCDDCGSEYPTPWFAPNDLWNRVIPNRAGMLCPNCFLFRAQSAGINPTGWEIREEGTQWIKITDDPQTLPEIDELVLVSWDHGMLKGLVRESRYLGEEYGWRGFKPNYWQPFPAPPPES